MFVHRIYRPIVCSYSVLVYNLQSFAKIVFYLGFFFWIPFVLYLFNLVDDIISDVNDDVIMTSLMMSSGMTSSVMCPITLHQKQTFHIHILRARAPRSRQLSTLGGLANPPVGGMPPGEVRLGFLDTSQMLFSS